MGDLNRRQALASIAAVASGGLVSGPAEEPKRAVAVNAGNIQFMQEKPGRVVIHMAGLSFAVKGTLREVLHKINSCDKVFVEFEEVDRWETDE